MKIMNHVEKMLVFHHTYLSSSDIRWVSDSFRNEGTQIWIGLQNQQPLLAILESEHLQRYLLWKVSGISHVVKL